MVSQPIPTRIAGVGLDAPTGFASIRSVPWVFAQELWVEVRTGLEREFQEGGIAELLDRLELR
jgi:hypothetical protein